MEKTKTNKNIIFNIIYTLSLVVIAGCLIAFWYFKYDYVPANRSEQYFLDGIEINKDDLLIEVEYDVVMTDLDTGKVYHRPITYHDTTAPEIVVDNGEYIYVRELSNSYYGLSIKDNYYPLSEIQITMEGVDNTKQGIYNAVVKAEDGSGNYREINTTVKVVGDKYIQDGILFERDFSQYKKYQSRTQLPEETVFEHIIKLPYSEIKSKIENKENVAVFFGYKGCPWCEDAEPVLNKAAHDLGMTVYMVAELDSSEGCSEEEFCEVKSNETSKDEIIEWLSSLEAKEQTTVPYLAVFKNGEKVADYSNINYLAYFRNLMPNEEKELEKTYIDMLSMIKNTSEESEE